METRALSHKSRPVDRTRSIQQLTGLAALLLLWVAVLMMLSLSATVVTSLVGA